MTAYRDDSACTGGVVRKPPVFDGNYAETPSPQTMPADVPVTAGRSATFCAR
jgi:hypothetical protein